MGRVRASGDASSGGPAPQIGDGDGEEMAGSIRRRLGLGEGGGRWGADDGEARKKMEEGEGRASGATVVGMEHGGGEPEGEGCAQAAGTSAGYVGAHMPLTILEPQDA